MFLDSIKYDYDDKNFNSEKSKNKKKGFMKTIISLFKPK